MIFSDFHVHTTFSDGKNTPEEMVLAAIQRGMTKIGFSDHSYTSFDESCCMAKENLSDYRETIAALKEKYRDQIEIFCGIEQDFYSDFPAEGYDYIIGSVHYLPMADGYICVDESPEALRAAAARYFEGDIYALAEEYYRTVAEVAEKTNAHIIGHFDLITKFNEGGRLFDETHPRYIAAWQAAADRLMKSGKPFEINTGAISRGYRTAPYPAGPIRDYLRSHGGKFLLSSDSHSAGTLCFDFRRACRCVPSERILNP